MRYLGLGDILELYRRIMEETGGATGVRDINGPQSALAQPRMTFEGRDLSRVWPKRQPHSGFRSS